MFKMVYEDLKTKNKTAPEVEQVLEEMLKMFKLSQIYKRNPYDLSSTVEIHYVFR